MGTIEGTDLTKSEHSITELNSSRAVGGELAETMRKDQSRPGEFSLALQTVRELHEKQSRQDALSMW